jgi:lysophospholipase L1-like esterase
MHRQRVRMIRGICMLSKSRVRFAWCLALSLALASVGQASQPRWVQTWGAAPLPPAPAMGPFAATPSFNNQTVRQTVRVSAGGARIRIRFTNEYGTKPLVIGSARVALADAKGQIQPGSEHAVLFSGQTSVAIPPAAPFVSDPVELPIKALSSLAISIYLPEQTGQCTCHQTGQQNAFISDTGDFTAKPFQPKETLQVRAFISGVEVEATRGARAVVVLGDSISDGVGSTVDANHRWPDLLANRLHAKGGDEWGVVNMGISGNRVLADGAGQSALARFDRDVLATTGAKAVIVFEGINDIGISYGHPQGPMADAFKAMAPPHAITSESMIAGYRQLIARAHAHGLKVIGATITPYGGASTYSPQGEAVRQSINTWIRTSREFDGVIDFDAVIRDPGNPAQIKEGWHMGDHLHGSDAGYAAMSAAIDLSVLD